MRKLAFSGSRGIFRWYFRCQWNPLTHVVRSGDGIGESLRNMGISRTETRRKVEELLERCGLEKEYADRYPQIVYLSCV